MINIINTLMLYIKLKEWILRILIIRKTFFFPFYLYLYEIMGFPCGAIVKNLPANAGDARDMGSIPESRRSPGVGKGNPLQYSCLENFMDRGACWATVCEVAKSQTRLSD